MSSHKWRHIPIIPKTKLQDPETPASDSTPHTEPEGVFLSWNIETGKEVEQHPKRKPTEEEAQKTKITRSVGACDDCRKGKRRCHHVHRTENPLNDTTEDKTEKTDEREAERTEGREAESKDRQVAEETGAWLPPALSVSAHEYFVPTSFDREDEPFTTSPYLWDSQLLDSMGTSETYPSTIDLAQIAWSFQSGNEYDTTTRQRPDSSSWTSATVQPSQIAPSSPFPPYPPIMLWDGVLDQELHSSSNESTLASAQFTSDDWWRPNSEPLFRGVELPTRSDGPSPRSSEVLSSSYASSIRSNGTSFSCKTCDKEFKGKSDLRYHSRVHRQGQYACDKCKKSFHYPKDLQRHLRIHDRIRTYGCSFDGCDASFMREDHLRRHQKNVHRGTFSSSAKEPTDDPS